MEITSAVYRSLAIETRLMIYRLLCSDVVWASTPCNVIGWVCFLFFNSIWYIMLPLKVWLDSRCFTYIEYILIRSYFWVICFQMHLKIEHNFKIHNASWLLSYESFEQPQADGLPLALHADAKASSWSSEHRCSRSRHFQNRRTLWYYTGRKYGMMLEDTMTHPDMVWMLNLSSQQSSQEAAAV